MAAKKAAKKGGKREALVAEYLSSIATTDDNGEIPEGWLRAVIAIPKKGNKESAPRVVVGSVGCPHCGIVSAALTPWTAGEIAGCTCVCHRAKEVLHRHAYKPTEDKVRRPTPPTELHVWPDTGAAAHYSGHPAAIAGRAAAVEGAARAAA